VGEEEFAQGKVALRSMKDGTQVEVQIDKLEQWLKEAIFK